MALTNQICHIRRLLENVPFKRVQHFSAFLLAVAATYDAKMTIGQQHRQRHKMGK